MTNKDTNFIKQRMSLRKPQSDGLEILATLADILPLAKNQDSAAALEAVKKTFPQVEDFERDFPSLCFALATGVGKTRLMGAFIAYLVRQKKSRHFLILAPNKTIYKKLQDDFNFSHPKYALTGMAEFNHTPPEIITGDNYQSGIGVRRDLLGWSENIHINIFNIQKISSEMRGGKSPLIKRLSETIGQSYFDYLAGLDDLVLLMDEAHHYRASAGAQAINGLKPVLGLELTATPQVESGQNKGRFKNIIQYYTLANALKDGFVKSPAATTRQNFNKNNYSDEEIERIKLDDGITLHEEAREALRQYADEKNKPAVKPFMLIIARDTAHAAALEKRIKNNDFYDGAYADKVIQIHSAQTGTEKDEVVVRLLAIESADEPTEIVIHVNMLKEGWDVTNLYTIVPLRAARARTLVEQSIGRGLRLPYGRRTGNPAVDRLNIVAHDHFDEIIAEAQRADSILQYVEQRELPEEGGTPMRKETIEVAPVIQTSICEQFPSDVEHKIAAATVKVINSSRFTKLASSKELSKTKIQKQITAEIKKQHLPPQQELDLEKVSIDKTVQKTIDLYQKKTIDIPRVMVLPKDGREGGYHFENFDLDTKPLGSLQPVSNDILIRYLKNQKSETISRGAQKNKEERIENLIISQLIGNYPDISYDDTASILQKLAAQAVTSLEERFKNKEKTKNVVQYHAGRIAKIIHIQMDDHYKEEQGELEVVVKQGFEILRTAQYAIAKGTQPHDYKKSIDRKRDIKQMTFTGFKRCLYQTQKFESNPERLFAVIIENEPQDLKWIKPAPGQIHIEYKLKHNRHNYNPDFIVETKTQKLLCEIKQAQEMESPDVQAKKNTAIEWCKNASAHEKDHGGKLWSYILIPDDEINQTSTLEGIVSQYKAPK